MLNRQRDLEDASKGAQVAAGSVAASVPDDLRSLSPDISTVPDVAAAMEVVQKAVDAARPAAKSAQDKQAEKDAEMPPTKAPEECPYTKDGPEEFEECDVDATVEELRQSDYLDVSGSKDGPLGRSKVRRFMEAVSRGIDGGLGDDENHTNPLGALSFGAPVVFALSWMDGSHAMCSAGSGGGRGAESCADGGLPLLGKPKIKIQNHIEK